MKKENDELLCQRFPKLYADRHADMRETCMCWGFACNDGWFDIILRLSEKLEKIIESLPPGAKNALRCSQVKEKFGTLRFYMNYYLKEAEDEIRKAEIESAKTCEDCGKPGKLIKGSWLRTLCKDCDRIRKTEMWKRVETA
jgi:hypothetical protein